MKHPEIFTHYVNNGELKQAISFFDLHRNHILKNIDMTYVLFKNFSDTSEYISFLTNIRQRNVTLYFSPLLNIEKTEDELIKLFYLTSDWIDKESFSSNLAYTFDHFYEKRYFKFLKIFSEFCHIKTKKLFTNKILFALIFKYKLHNLFEDFLVKELFNPESIPFFSELFDLFNVKTKSVNKDSNLYYHVFKKYKEEEYACFFPDDELLFFIFSHSHLLGLFKANLNVKKIKLIELFLHFEKFESFTYEFSPFFNNVLEYNSQTLKSKELDLTLNKIKLQKEMNNF